MFTTTWVPGSMFELVEDCAPIGPGTGPEFSRRGAEAVAEAIRRVPEVDAESAQRVDGVREVGQ